MGKPVNIQLEKCFGYSPKVDVAVMVQALLPVMMTERFRDLHAATLKRQWFGLVCIGLFMVSDGSEMHPLPPSPYPL